jgi:hypothetical protein
MFICKNYKKDLMTGLHNINDDYYIALFHGKIKKNISSYYDLNCEINHGNGYELNGKQLKNAQIIEDDNVVILNFDNPFWEMCSFKTNGALIYNNSLPEKNAIAVILFEEVKKPYYDDFMIEFPIPNKKEGFIKII